MTTLSKTDITRLKEALDLYQYGDEESGLVATSSMDYIQRTRECDMNQGNIFMDLHDAAIALANKALGLPTTARAEVDETTIQLMKGAKEAIERVFNSDKFKGMITSSEGTDEKIAADHLIMKLQPLKTLLGSLIQRSGSIEQGV